VLLDEPTRGLHPADVERLLRVFDRLVEAGHSLVVVEHDLAVVAAADHVIDLGPEAAPAAAASWWPAAPRRWPLARPPTPAAPSAPGPPDRGFGWPP